MRILMVSGFGYVRGGLERVMFDELRWLRDAGHDVDYFATADERNVPSRFSGLFPAAHDYSLTGRPTVAGVRDIFWNPRTAAAFASILEEFRPDVVHSHGVSRHLSPSILPEAKRRDVPVVMTAHDYGLVCPGIMLRGRVVPCSPRACGRRFFGKAALHRCVHGSLPRSALGAVEATVQHVLNQYEAFIRTVICPSRFMAETLADGGVTPKLVVVPNAVPEVPTCERPAGGPFVVSGRVSAEKGVATALEAARLANVPMVIAGTGPLLDPLAASYPTADFVGHLPQEALGSLMNSATAVIVPSQWFENASITVLEAMAAGSPVVASHIGGIPEQVTDGRDGLLVPPGDEVALAAAMAALWAEPRAAAAMGAKGRQTVHERYHPEKHVAGLVKVYRDAVESGQ
jgi:glycosyltransferase involved in cell wall biosynthesis